MIIDQSSRLHHRVANRRSHELESAPDQLLANRVRVLGPRRNLLRRPPRINSRTPTNQSPDIFVETAKLRLNRDKRFRIPDRRIDLQTITNDSRIRQQARNLSLAELRNRGRIEAGKRIPIILPLTQNSVPAKSSLRPLQNKKLEPAHIIMHRHAPLFIVIPNRKLITSPRTSFIVHRKDEPGCGLKGLLEVRMRK